MNKPNTLSASWRFAWSSLVFMLVGALAVSDVSAQTNTNTQQQGGGGGRGAGGRGARGGRGAGGFAAPRGVYKSTITPHWINENAMFWYENELKGDTREFILVDAEKGTREPAFDHQKLAAALSKAADQAYTGDKLPFKEIEFVDGVAAVQFKVGEKTWKCDLKSYACAEVKKDAALTIPATQPDTVKLADLGTDSDDLMADEVASSDAELDDALPPSPEPGRGGGGGGGGRGGGFNARPTSPDGKWTAFVQDMNVFVVSNAAGTNTQLTTNQLTTDGVEGNAYQGLYWSQDSQALAAWRVEPGERKQIYYIQSSPAGGGRTVETQVGYAQAGDKYTLAEINVFDMATMKQIKPKTDRWTDGNYGGGPPGVRWEKDGRHFTYEFPERGHQRWRLVEVDSRTGDVRNLIDEQSKDFIWTAHPDENTAHPLGFSTSLVRYMTQTEELIYITEKDNWKHFYLVDVKSGNIKPITHGEWAVRSIERIDEDNRQIWFGAGGKNAGEDPYDVHYYRVNFDGSGLTELTGGDGNHSIQFSPDRKYIIDTFSHVDVPPTHTLHRVSDGKLMCKLEDADITELKATGWKPVQSFVAKGRDGKTDIYGTITWPRDFDPNKKYPVIENIYAGPQMASVPHSFSAGGGRGGVSYGDLGFITVQIDGMGTPYRSHAFHAVCWQNLGRDNGFPDRILWHKAVAAKYPAYDITRVGIRGTSAGGQSAASAVIFHSDFYRAACENSGCVDNRIDKASWNEQWMGYLPGDKIWSKDADNWFSQCSCIDNAARLGGALLILVGEQDHNVPPESSLRLANELMLANKDFEMYYVPNAGHGIVPEPAAGSLPVGSQFTGRREREFFQRTLLGKVFPIDNSGGSKN